MKTQPRLRYLKIILGLIKNRYEERDIVESFYLVFLHPDSLHSVLGRANHCEKEVHFSICSIRK